MRKDLNIASPKDTLHPDIFPPIPEKDRAQLAAENGTLIDEGIKALEKAIELKPDYVDAIAYMNLMYREKADLEADPSARNADVAKANDLNAQANNLIKKQQEKAAQTTK